VFQAMLGGDDGEQIIDGRCTDFGQHRFTFGGRFGKVAHLQLSALSFQLSAKSPLGKPKFGLPEKNNWRVSSAETSKIKLRTKS
jgi:hypothetical protein